MNKNGATSETPGGLSTEKGIGRQTASAERPTRAVSRPLSTPSPMRAEIREDGAVLQLFFSPAAWSAERVEELSGTLREVLSLAAADPGLPVGDLPLALPARPGRITGHSLSAPQFNF